MADGNWIAVRVDSAEDTRTDPDNSSAMQSREHFVVERYRLRYTEGWTPSVSTSAATIQAYVGADQYTMNPPTGKKWYCTSDTFENEDVHQIWYTQRQTWDAWSDWAVFVPPETT